MKKSTGKRRQAKGNNVRRPWHADYFYLLLFAFCLLIFSAPVKAQEWYLPKQTRILKQGSGEIGSRMQYASNRDGVEWDRTIETVLSLRYAPLNRLELYAEGPYIFRDNRQVVFPNLEHSYENGFGDVFAQINYELAGGSDWKVMLSTDAVFPTGPNIYEQNKTLGNGFYTVAPGLTFIQVVDPASIFLYLGYQWTLPEEFEGIGKIAPGEDFRFRLGASLMLSPRLRATIYTAGDVLAHTYFNGTRLPQTDGDLIRFGGGLSWNVNDRYKVEMSSVFGATPDAPDAVISLGLTRSF